MRHVTVEVVAGEVNGVVVVVVADVSDEEEEDVALNGSVFVLLVAPVPWSVIRGSH